MKFHTLTIQNFLTIREASVQLADKGLQLVQGVNADDSSATSNGAGKSSLVDAISWCLYGLTAREVTGDAVINLGAKKDCMVSLVITNGSERYRVTRYRKHATGKNTLVVEDCTEAAGKGEPTDLSRGTDTETQKVLEKILGCSYEVFIAAVYSGQEAMPDLPRMKDRELKTLIEEAAGMQRIERAYEEARDRMSTAKTDLAQRTTKLESTKVTHVMAFDALEEVKTRAEIWESEREARVDESASLLEQAEADHDTVAWSLAKIDKATADAGIAEIDAKLAAHKSAERASYSADMQVRSAELAVDTGSLKRLAAQITEIETQIANAETEIKKPCGSCGTILSTMSVEDFVAHKNGHLATAKTKLVEAKVVATKQVATIKELRETAATLRAAIPDVSALTAEREVHAKVVADWTSLDVNLKRKSADATALTNQLTLRKTEKNPHVTGIETSEKRLATVAAEIAALEADVSNLTKTFDISAAVVKVFGPAGVRAQILDSVTPFLNERTADYLSALTDGHAHAEWTTLTRSASGDLKEKFSIAVSHDKGGDSFKAISGGEKRKVRLATALALQDLVASRATQPINLWVGDELDDALDPAGLERLMTILERRARERGTVLIISHSDLKDWCDEVTTVTKTGQWHSVVSGSLCT